MIVVEARLQPPQFFQISLLRHIQRTSFYFYAITAAVLTALSYTMVLNTLVLMVAWIPFGTYIILGIINAFIGSRRKDAPYFLPTRYEFGEETLKMSTEQGTSTLAWPDFREWRKVVGCYVFYLNGGSIFAFPISEVPKGRIPALEDFLKKKIPI